MNEEIKCDICGKTGFKSKAGLAGHKKIAHGEDRRKTIPDEIGKRLQRIETAVNRLVGIRVAKDIVRTERLKSLSGDEVEALLLRDDQRIIRKCIDLFFSGFDYDKALNEYLDQVIKNGK